jgi:drug/metabolite transporter superfamily protein YnfA
MTRATTVTILFAAALLEAGGDALIRFGLRSAILWQRALLFTIAALILFAYGWTVNRPPWDFGQLLGLYVVFFFVIAQLISWLAFQQMPSTHVLLGGALIIAGGAVIALGS